MGTSPVVAGGTGGTCGGGGRGFAARLEADAAAFGIKALVVGGAGLFVGAGVAEGATAGFAADLLLADLPGFAVAVGGASADEVFGEAEAAAACISADVSGGAEVIGDTGLDATGFAAGELEALKAAGAGVVDAFFARAWIDGDGFGFARAAGTGFTGSTVGVGGAGDGRASPAFGDAHFLTEADISAAVLRRATLVGVAGLGATVSLFESDTDIVDPAAVIGFGARLTEVVDGGDAFKNALLIGTAGEAAAAVGGGGAVEAGVEVADHFFIVGCDLAIELVDPFGSESRGSVVH